MPAKKDQYRIFVAQLAPRWGVRTITSGFDTLTGAEAFKAVLASKARSMGYSPTITIVAPGAVRAKVIQTSAHNLTKLLNETSGSGIASDFDDALPRLEKLARYYYTLRDRYEAVSAGSWTGELRTVRKGALGTEAGLRFIFEYKLLADEHARFSDYRYTAEENIEMGADYGGVRREARLDEYRNQKERLVAEFVASTIHADEW